MAATKKTTTTKTTTATKPKAAPARPRKVAPAGPADTVIAAVPQATASTPALKKKDLIERVTARSDVKKRDVKSVVEAVLEVLGDALSKGEELNIPPFGKAKVNRQKDLAVGEKMVVQLRRGGQKQGPGKKQKVALAEAGE